MSFPVREEPVPHSLAHLAENGLVSNPESRLGPALGVPGTDQRESNPGGIHRSTNHVLETTDMCRDSLANRRFENLLSEFCDAFE